MPISRSFPASDWQKARGDHARDSLGLARLAGIRSCSSLAEYKLFGGATIALCPIAGKRQRSTIAKDVSEIPGKP